MHDGIGAALPPSIGLRARLRATLVETGWGFALLIALMMVIIVAAIGTTAGHSGALNLAWYTQYREALLDGTLPRHLPQMWQGAGALDFFFYGQVPYFAATLLSLPCGGCAPDQVFAAGTGVGYGLSVLSFFAFARRFTGREAALAGAVLYALLPYHLGVDWVWRQAAGEVWAYVFTPLLARGVDVVLRERRFSLSLPVAFALLLMTHLASSLLAVHILALVVLVWALWLRDPARIGAALARLAWLAVVGAAMAALFWATAIVLLNDVSPGELYQEYFDPTRWLLNPFDLGFLYRDYTTMKFVLVALFLSGIAGLLAIFVGARAGWSADAWIWLLVPAVASVFLMSFPARPLWEFGLLAKVQFPWRLMIFVDLSAALGAALAVDVWRRRGGQLVPAVLAAVTAGALALNMHILVQQGPVPVAQYSPAYTSVTEYLPAPLVEAFHAANAYPLPWITAGQQRETVEVIARNPRETVLRPDPGQTEVFLAVPWWPHWQARDATGALRIDRDPAGFMVISADPVRPLAGDVTVFLPVLPVEKVTGAVSASGLLALAATAWWQRRRRKAVGGP